jgi:CRP/FNR family cyclic AMP-dependent transcriptional regulator
MTLFADARVPVEDKERLIGSNFLFRGLDPELLRQLARMSRVQHLAKGATLFHQGDEGGAMYGIFRGSVRISVVGPEGKELTLCLMEPGDVVGEIALLDGLPRTADARTVEDTTLLVIDRAPFMDLLSREPRLARHVIELLCERLRLTNEFVSDVAFLHLQAHLAKRLLSLAIAHGVESTDGVRIGLKLSQTDLAQMLGVTREAINKQLKRWTRAGVLRFDRGHLVLIKREVLQALAHS